MRNRIFVAFLATCAAASAMAVTVDFKGAVVKPGSITLETNTCLRQAIDAAGGLSGNADPMAISIVRADGVATQVDLTKLGPTPMLKAGDVVTVPEFDSSKYVMVAGAVSNPGALPYHDGITVGEVLKSARPFDDIDIDKVRIVDKNGVKALPEGITEEALYTMVLAPGEAVKVNYPGQSFSNRELIIVIAVVVLILLLR
ncbi:MAG: SLBB domain-containing protein [Fimbriimonadales bacterium]